MAPQAVPGSGRDRAHDQRAGGPEDAQEVVQGGRTGVAQPRAVFFYQYYSERRHETNANPLPDHPSRLHPAHDWKMRERLKTVSVALVLCLNIGIDPPDIVKTSPCAKLEAWVDPFSMAPQKALDTIGRNLQQQYEVWQPRARYKLSLDPSVEETKKLCVGLRRNAKDERILFHYNGHGVPKPTQGGEIWVFNKNYTQYIPVSIYELQTWLGSPCIFVYDCSNAGNILTAFNRFAEQRDTEALRQLASLGGSQSSLPPGSTPGTPPGSSSNVASGPPPYVPFRDCIQLAACGPTEILPMNPDLPADIFTCCLTTPIEIALRWFVMQKSPLSNITPEMINKIPGKLNDRRTPLGELNWIFTAITDTIAWNVLPHDLFKRLFRQDLMVAALFRNYLLAERVMRSFKCTPMSYPALPPTHQHPLWQSWDLAADMVLSQLPALLAAEEAQANSQILQIANVSPGIPTSVPAAINAAAEARGTQLPAPGTTGATPPTPVTPLPSAAPSAQSLPDPAQQPLTTYRHSAFFAEQLTAFEVWLAKGAISKRLPEQLPIVLQVLLSQVHRLRALMLLSRFLDLGPWSVNLALSVGIFPYVLKLLQSPAAELKPVLVFIWAKILAVDSSCQNELLKDTGFMYFVNILASSVNMPPVPNISEHRAMCCFILSVFCHEFRAGQQACLKANVLGAAVVHLTDSDPLLRQWAAVCIGKLWERLPEAKFAAIKDSVHEKLCAMLGDVVPEVRAAAMFAIGAFMGDADRSENVVNIEHNVSISVLAATADASPLVRRELVVCLSKVVWFYSKKFVDAAFELLGEDQKRTGGSTEDPRRAKRAAVPNGGQGGAAGRAGGQDGASRAGNVSVYTCIWKVLLNLSVDPHPEVASYASRVVDYINLQLVTANLLDTNPSADAPIAVTSAPSLGSVNGGPSSGPSSLSVNGIERAVTASPKTMPSSAGLAINLNSSLSLGTKVGNGNNIRRSASFAYSLRNITGLSTSHSSDNILVGVESGRITPKGTPTLPGVAGYIRPRFAHLGNRSSPNLVATANAVASLAASPDAEKYEDVPATSAMSEDGRISIASSSVFGGAEGLPLESVFYDWCCEYFAEPQMKVPEVDDPGSVRSNERLWRQQRNNRVLYESKLVHELSGTTKFEERSATLANDGEPAKVLCFHQFEDHLVVANDKDTISVWDWKQSSRLNIFSNGNPTGSRPTSVRFINEEDVALLLVGSDEGVVRLYRNYESPERIEIVSAWRALTDLFPTSRGTGLITDWQQVTGSLLVAGDVKFIRVWDAEKELCVQDFPTKSNSSVTSMTSDRVSGMHVVGGFTDGAVRIYDRRSSSRDSLAMVLQQPNDSSPIVNVHLRPGSQDLVAGATSGEVRIWDLRQQSSVRTISMFQQSEMVTMSVHNHAPIIASASSNQLIKMTNLEGHILSMIRPYEGGVLGSFRSVIHTLTLHPHRLVLASGSADGHVLTWRSEAERMSESGLIRPV